MTDLTELCMPTCAKSTFTLFLVVSSLIPLGHLSASKGTKSSELQVLSYHGIVQANKLRYRILHYIHVRKKEREGVKMEKMVKYRKDSCIFHVASAKFEKGGFSVE